MPELTEQSITNYQEQAYKFGERLAKQHGNKDYGNPPKDKLLAMLGLVGVEEDIAEGIFEQYEEGYFNKKFTYLGNED